jgi:Fur family transcriptional regulator, ferric uptake regulator
MPDPILGQRQTRQRDAILGVIRDSAGPLTVQEVHERGQQQVPGLGIATVYRTLKLLLDARQIQTVVLPSGETRYEPAELGHHHHFHCRVCDLVYDLDTCPFEIPLERPFPGGYQVDAHEITLYGTCPACHA